MRSRPRYAGILAVAVMGLAPRARAQQAGSASAPAVGDVAPDFTLPGATRYGVLKAPVHLADHRGETVVLAFFYQARTKG
jgi:thioredoxin-dependent peroxiredoxin